MMKAVLCTMYGPPESLVLTDIESPRPGPDQVLISVKACALSFPDTLIIQGKYQFQPPMPFSPGGEVTGIVKEIGQNVTHVKVGDHVMAFTGWGGFAEEVVAETNRVIPIPPSLDLTIATAFAMTYGTSYYSLKDRAQLKPGESLLVLGAAGGVGLAAVEIGKAMGARIIAAASTDEKLAVCKEYGAEQVINYASEDLKARIKELTGGQGVDVIFDPVGSIYSEPAMRGMAWGGRFLVVGFAAGEIPRVPLNLTLLKGFSIVGVFWGSFVTREPEHNRRSLQEMLEWHRRGMLNPLISATYPLSRAADALNDMMQRRVKGKVVLLIDKG